MAQTDARALLLEALRLAMRLEELAALRKSRRPLLIVGQTSLIRTRRLAAAIARLGEPHAYEARVLLRALLEIKINYSWIRLRKTYSRALRFVKFLPIERMKLLNRFKPELTTEQFKQMKRRWERDRSTVRHLFRVRNGNAITERAVRAEHTARSRQSTAACNAERRRRRHRRPLDRHLCGTGRTTPGPLFS